MRMADVGMIGLAVMGENLALNLESKGYMVALYNRETESDKNVVGNFLISRGKGGNFVGTDSLEDLVRSIDRPRKIMMMIKAGFPVDDVLHQLSPLLDPGDVVIDGGNSYFLDTARRVVEMEKLGVLYVGAGVSGGAEGALNGPSIMPGGAAEAWPVIKNMLQDIAAKLDDGTPCCQWIGPGGSGHFVKMVHNGIEYADMQIIAEVYALLKSMYGDENDRISAIFDDWNKGELNSYLIEITAEILKYKDTDGNYLIDRILDVAGQKGTGKWSVEAAIEENNPLTLITEAVYARVLSDHVVAREIASRLYPGIPGVKWSGKLVESDAVKNALYAAKLVSYAQGFTLLKQASDRYDWHLDYGTIAMIWRKGCIIRSRFLGEVTKAYRSNVDLENLLFDSFFVRTIKKLESDWRHVVSEGVMKGIAMPCTMASISYFDGLKTLHSTANLIQAQRDYFGAHTYERNDAPRGIFYHTDWKGTGEKTTSGSYNV